MPLLQPRVSAHPLSPRRPVPASIERPHYVDVANPREDGDLRIKDAETIEKMRIASRIAATAMVEASKAIAPGVTTDELDAGDIVNIDVTAYIHGVHGDTDATYLVGDVDEESRLLVERTHEAMMRGIRAARPGREINVIGRVIESYAKRFGYGVVRDFTGHGIGLEFHSGLIVPHYDAAPHYETVIEPGMTFTIEPMLNLGTHEWDMWDDRWTVVTRDRRRSAQFEHTILITDDGHEILTLPDVDTGATGATA